MQTECNTNQLDFQPLEKRKLVGIFDGGAITSDAGGLLLREVEAKMGIIGRFAECFTDHRDPERIEHSVEHLVAQRVYGLALGYEDLNDHDQLRHDPLMAVLVGKQDPTGQDRVRERDRGKAEHIAKGPNPRFVVTSLSQDEYDGRKLYEDLHCARGEMENRIKEQQLMLFADRTSAEDMRANQIRLYFSSIAYVLLSAMRRIGLADTSFERAQCREKAEGGRRKGKTRSS